MALRRFITIKGGCQVGEILPVARGGGFSRRPVVCPLFLDGQVSHTDQMKHRIDSDQGKRMITRRFATVEPVFGNVRGNKRLDRFTLRGRKKVDGHAWCTTWRNWRIMATGYEGYERGKYPRTTPGRPG
jgi:hypothetical protein